MQRHVDADLRHAFGHVPCSGAIEACGMLQQLSQNLSDLGPCYTSHAIALLVP